MIKHNLHIFFQNVRKNKILTDTILETQKSAFDIIFIQEPPRSLICYIPSHTKKIRIMAPLTTLNGLCLYKVMELWKTTPESQYTLTNVFQE